MDGTNTHDMKIAKNLMLHELHNIQKQRQWGSSNFKRQKKVEPRSSDEYSTALERSRRVETAQTKAANEARCQSRY